ncbi:DUF1471 domain-containing protein [Photobacterium swingsii]|uniref:DUF1471 domain-containing protein n=1 Tax=Photobacterium swingsii TaxID=680026 RepID=UPI0040675E3B
MKALILFSCILLTLTGCATKKIRIEPGAQNIANISETSARLLGCQLLKAHTIKDAHPNNVDRELKNVTFQSGGSHYSIVEVLETRKRRPSSVVAAIYQCSANAPQETNNADSVKLLPGAHQVKAITFAEIENTACKVLGSQFIKETTPENLEVNLANEAYMMSGNRYQVTKIVATEHGAPTSVYADIYRCKHQTAHY